MFILWHGADISIALAVKYTPPPINIIVLINKPKYKPMDLCCYAIALIAKYNFSN